jgi:hypothetical protein
LQSGGILYALIFGTFVSDKIRREEKKISIILNLHKLPIQINVKRVICSISVGNLPIVPIGQKPVEKITAKAQRR